MWEICVSQKVCGTAARSAVEEVRRELLGSEEGDGIKKCGKTYSIVTKERYQVGVSPHINYLP